MIMAPPTSLTLVAPSLGKGRPSVVHGSPDHKVWLVPCGSIKLAVTFVGSGWAMSITMSYGSPRPMVNGAMENDVVPLER